MKVLYAACASLVLAVQARPVAAQETQKADAQAAVKVAVGTCAICHGPRGNSVVPKFPRLAGQNADYMAAQLKAFRGQTRGDPDAIAYMWGMAAPLSDDMIGALARYYAVQSPAPRVQADPALVVRGADIYKNGVASENIPACATCHGANAQGMPGFPRLAGQHAEYLIKQLYSFRNELRNVAIMHGVAKEMKLNEMEAVAAFLQSR
jgi:cytochrome c553